jgi:hypothetical protein
MSEITVIERSVIRPQQRGNVGAVEEAAGYPIANSVL